MSETCALCLREKTLKESHLIPKFVGKWLKDNGTGFLVSAADGSKRVQDLVKIKLLCGDCEQKFSKLENYFASRVFYPFVDAKIPEFDYDENLKPFIISMAWRCLQLIKENFFKESPSPQVSSFVRVAEKEWREFLNNEGVSIDSYETHLIFLDYIDNTKNVELDPKFHWYLLHGTDLTIGCRGSEVFFYVKLPWILFIISIEPKKLEGLEGTIIVKSGHISTEQTLKNPYIMEVLLDRAKAALHSSEGPSNEVSARRLEKVIKKDPEKYLTSNIYESYIVERDNVRRQKMKNMPKTLIELVEIGILNAKAPPEANLVVVQAHKMTTRRIADKIADLSEDDAERFHEMIYSVAAMSKMTNENKQNTFTSNSLYITYMISWDKSNETRQESVKKEMDKLKTETQDKIHYAVFSFSPISDNYMTLYFAPKEEQEKNE